MPGAIVTRSNVRYAATWRLLAELMRRHQARRDLRLYWFFPGISGTGIARLRRPDGAPVLDLDVVCGEVSRPEGIDEGVRRYVQAMLVAEDPKSVVDAIQEACGLGQSPEPLPASNASVLCARVVAGVLERGMLDRTPLRTTPGYFDQNGYVDALGWAAELAGVADALARARAAGRAQDESVQVQHLFALHRGEAVLGLGASDGAPFVAFDLRKGVAHAVRGQARSSVALLELYERVGRRIEPLLDWVELWL